jgi:hypothetical protein
LRPVCNDLSTQNEAFLTTDSTPATERISATTGRDTLACSTSASSHQAPLATRSQVDTLNAPVPRQPARTQPHRPNPA